MIIARTIAELRQWRQSVLPTDTVGFVPTMGALHEGHLSLIRQSKASQRFTVCSIFVNPLQFGPHEDFEKYPRVLEKDMQLLERERCDLLFTPSADELYPPGFSTFVVEEKVSAPLCGTCRPGHFRGVATVVVKLFHLVQPHTAYFGQKDAQQCAVIERVVRDLHLPVQVVRVPTVREPDGLALSSRNLYLSPQERIFALQIIRSLRAVESQFLTGERSVAVLEALGKQILAQQPALRMEYWQIRDPETLEQIETIGPRGGLAAVAAYVGKTRLIDNLLLKP